MPASILILRKLIQALRHTFVFMFLGMIRIYSHWFTAEIQEMGNWEIGD